ncbi:ArsR/SmtB family transcription factor [Lentibacillus saliphilus]|uniref:ArsR/SmtB family transcription factor n=1 Tax=Lentibacillus saliphilus TaxID=2737028 RepID=UPI001C30A6E2|nr:metalloregulator ArsR/SmtB family transcription factor [Lentibacillus saliphilus]
MATQDLDLKVKFLHGFSNKIRIQILDSIKDKEKTVSQIMDDVDGSQSSISQHLACLRGCGLIVGRQEGKYMYYRLLNDKVRHLLNMFDDVLMDVQTGVMSCDRQIDDE